MKIAPKLLTVTPWGDGFEPIARLADVVAGASDLARPPTACVLLDGETFKHLRHDINGRESCFDEVRFHRFEIPFLPATASYLQLSAATTDVVLAFDTGRHTAARLADWSDFGSLTLVLKCQETGEVMQTRVSAPAEASASLYPWVTDESLLGRLEAFRDFSQRVTEGRKSELQRTGVDLGKRRIFFALLASPAEGHFAQASQHSIDASAAFHKEETGPVLRPFAEGPIQAFSDDTPATSEHVSEWTKSVLPRHVPDGSQRMRLEAAAALACAAWTKYAKSVSDDSFRIEQSMSRKGPVVTIFNEVRFFGRFFEGEFRVLAQERDLKHWRQLPAFFFTNSSDDLTSGAAIDLPFRVARSIALQRISSTDAPNENIRALAVSMFADRLLQRSAEAIQGSGPSVASALQEQFEEGWRYVLNHASKAPNRKVTVERRPVTATHQRSVDYLRDALKATRLPTSPHLGFQRADEGTSNGVHLPQWLSEAWGRGGSIRSSEAVEFLGRLVQKLPEALLPELFGHLSELRDVVSHISFQGTDAVDRALEDISTALTKHHAISGLLSVAVDKDDLANADEVLQLKNGGTPDDRWKVQTAEGQLHLVYTFDDQTNYSYDELPSYDFPSCDKVLMGLFRNLRRHGKRRAWQSTVARAAEAGEPLRSGYAS